MNIEEALWEAFSHDNASGDSKQLSVAIRVVERGELTLFNVRLSEGETFEAHLIVSSRTQGDNEVLISIPRERTSVIEVDGKRSVHALNLPVLSMVLSWEPPDHSQGVKKSGY
jgi:hypothetical protein